MSNHISNWMHHIENILIEIGKNPEKKFAEETDKFQEWEKTLEKQESDLNKMMTQIGKWFES